MGSERLRLQRPLRDFWIYSRIIINSLFSVKCEDKDISGKPKARGIHLDFENLLLLFNAKLYYGMVLLWKKNCLLGPLSRKSSLDTPHYLQCNSRAAQLSLSYFHPRLSCELSPWLQKNHSIWFRVIFEGG